MNKSISKKINPSKSWPNQLLSSLSEHGIYFIEIPDTEYHLFQAEGVILNLINLENPHAPQDLITLQAHYANKGIKLIHLWEDVWLSKSTQVIARLKSILGVNRKIHGRQTKIEKLTKPLAESFLNSNHLQGYVSSRYKLGLFFKTELVAVATFSALRKMNHTEHYKSAELIRFAVQAGYSVSGGLSKLISSFRESHQPNDLMTYADRDWSAGEAYLTLGFECKNFLEPQFFILNEDYQRQLDKADSQNSTLQVFNTGSIKYILKF
ncbi:hypothetical protein DHW03_03425 [Pedobacter yonginense]|uniref:Uncharacterized protein n=1 Tax=Pedobacter yonginense TaxID=651869 RepID=A0A317ES29_9SPHI|nr:hypothetical protein [Pedobacter yonginense]PWS28897.1 hypothetical protein DHW03_03425 [Pedobacter yonginense]